MFAHAQMFEGIFKLILFSLLAYKLYDLVKKFLLPWLYEEIILEHRHHTELIEKDTLLTSTTQRIENQITTQKKLFAILEKNIQITEEFLHNQKKEQELAYQKIDAKLKLKRNEQKQRFSTMKNCEAVIPQAMIKAQQQLTQHYETHRGADLMNTIIKQLPKKINQGKAL